MYIIYKRTSPSGHSYIGYTKLPLMKRWKVMVESSKTSNTRMSKAIRKYGPDSWKHDILFETDDKQMALDAEEVYISLLGYYNTAKGGEGGDVFCYLPLEQQENIRNCASARSVGKTTVKDDQGNTFKVSVDDPRVLSGELVGVSTGIKRSDETREKVRQAKLNTSDETKRKMSENNAMKSEVHRAKVAATKVGALNPNAKSCVINGVVYPTAKEASKQLGMVAGTVQYRLLATSTKWKDWRYL